MQEVTEATRIALWLKQTLQDSKCLLLFSGCPVFNDAMKLLNQDTGVCFLSFEFEERCWRNAKSRGDGAYDL